MKIRVCFIVSYFKALGGSEKNIIDLIHRLDKERFLPFLVVLDGGPLADSLAEEGIPVLDVRIKKILSFSALVEGFRLIRFFRANQISLVVTYHHDADIWGGLFAWLARIPVVSSRRDMGFQLKPKHILIYRLLNRMFARVIAVSESVKQRILSKEWAPSECITVIPNGVETSLYNPSIDKRRKKLELGLSLDKATVGMVASFRPVKGQEFFVRAAEVVRRRTSQVQFLIVGSKEGDYFPRVARLIEELGLQRDVVCLGSRADIPEILSVLDVFVLSSLNEGFSNAIIEAMASGVPVIAPRIGGNTDAIVHRKTGFLVEPQDTSGLAQTIAMALEDAALRRSVADQAKAVVGRRFSIERMIQTTAAVFEDVASGATS